VEAAAAPPARDGDYFVTPGWRLHKDTKVTDHGLTLESVFWGYRSSPDAPDYRWMPLAGERATSAAHSWLASHAWPWLQKADDQGRLAKWDGTGQPPADLGPALKAWCTALKAESKDAVKQTDDYHAAYEKLYAGLDALPQLFIAV
jgi:hypothetical protein